MRLDHFLARRTHTADAPPMLAKLSRARLQQLISSEAVLVDAKASSSAAKLRGGERITVRMPPAAPSPLAPCRMPLEILYEDADLIALNKASGVVVHAGAGVHGPTLVQGLLAHCGDLSGIGGVLRPGIVHRLDRDTSGVMVVAKHDRAHVALARQFAQREVLKIYVAVVFGALRPSSGSLETPYGRHPRLRQLFTSKASLLGELSSAQPGSQVRRAVSGYRTVAQAHGLSLLRVKLGTGRTHQIRVHMSDQGHQVVGDRLYGGRLYDRITDPATRLLAEALPYQALHAAKLEILHPISGVTLVLRARLPVSMLDLAEAVAMPLR